MFNLKAPNLLVRTLTAAVLIPLVFLMIFFCPERYFLWISGIIFMIAGWEWSALCGIKTKAYRILYTILLLIFMLASLTLPLKTLLIMGVLMWFLAIINFFQYSIFFIQLAGIVMLLVCWHGITYLCFLNPHPMKLIYLFLIVWGSDTIAYFVGAQFGRHPLAPKISPKKSIEGAVGAIVIVTLMMAFIFHSFAGLVLSIVTIIMSIVGDLFESTMKRRQNIKDSSNILPGHGGILDRIDSLIAAVPVFALGYYYFGALL